MKGRKLTKPANLYPIRAAARLTQLSIDTLRAWEKRYGVVRPVRKNGVRLYSDGDIERLRLLRLALEKGHSIGQASALSNDDLSALAGPSRGRGPDARKEGPIEEILAAVDRFEYARADRELGRLAALMPAREVIYQVVLPLLRIAGEQWHEERMRVSQEHLLSQLLGNLLGGMIRTYAPERPAASVLTATLSDDLHEFGILIAAMLAAGAGLGIVHLGPNLPAVEVAYAAKRSAVNVVLLSLTNVVDAGIRNQQLRLLRSRLPANVELWAGVNPPQLEIESKDIRVLRDFKELEREYERLGGRL